MTLRGRKFSQFGVKVSNGSCRKFGISPGSGIS